MMYASPAAAHAASTAASATASGSSGSTLVGPVSSSAPAPPHAPGPNPSTVQATPTRVSNNNVIFDPSVTNFLDTAMAGTVTMCFCHRFLNPFGANSPSLTSQCLVNPCLLHYCRVCNIQLNSCRQAKIHSEGKKHEKRLSYLKFCLESTDSTVSNPVAAQPSNTAQSAALPPPPQAAPQPQPPPVNQSVVLPGSTPNMAGSSTTSTVYYGQSVQQPQPQVNYPPAYYYPQPAAVPPPPVSGGHAGQPQPQSTPQGYPAAMYTYSEYTSPPPAGPTQVPTMMHMIDYNLDTGNSVTGATGVTVGVNGGGHLPPVSSAMPPHQVGHGHPPVHHPVHHGQQNGGHGVMSPSLTSGFSGSGDCKSTETSSILSAASYSSGALNNSGHSYGGYSDQYYGSKHRNYYYHHNNGGQSANNNSYHDQAPAWNHYQNPDNHVNYYNNNNNNNNNYVSDYHHTSPNSTGSTGCSSTVNSESKINSNNSNQSMINSSTNSSTNASSSSVYCDTCQIAFPSMAVLENHLKGSRHARRVKSQQAFRQLKDAGTLFRIRGSATPVTDIGMSSGAIRCEVCQVSVNSSHQLQAHLTGHKHRVRAIRRGVKTNQAVLSSSSSLLTSSTSVSEMSYTGTTSGGSSLMSNSPSNNLSNAISSHVNQAEKQAIVSSSSASSKKSSQKNNSSPDHMNVKKGDKSMSISTGTLSGGKNRIRERRSSTKMVKKSAVVSSHSDSSTTSQHQNQKQQKQSDKQKQSNNVPVNIAVSSQKSDDKQSSMALSRHRSSGCLQSRHCHSTLSLSRARSSSALNRVQSRSMNLLMIQNNSVNNNKHGMKNTSSDVLSMASSSSSSSSSANEMVDDEEEDEGVATDATADNGNSNNISTAKKDIKSATKSRSAPHRNIRINQEDGLAKEMAWMRLSNGQSNALKTDENIIPNGKTHHEKKIFKRGFNVNAQEWKPTSMRRTSVGNASVKDIPMLDVFLQRLDRRHSNNSNYNNKSDSKVAGKGSNSANSVKSVAVSVSHVSNNKVAKATKQATPSP